MRCSNSGHYTMVLRLAGNAFSGWGGYPLP